MISESAQTRIKANPYVGPRPFETGRQIFGRDREIDDLYYLLSAERIVLLHSPSGAGKSSLVQAGLVPRLAGRFDVWGPTRVNLHSPEGLPGNVNRYARSAILGFEQGIPESRRRDEAQLVQQSLAEYVKNRPRRRSAPENIILLFDQFEEILTADPLAIEAKREFFDQLGELLLDPRIWALFALREDYLAPLDPYAEQVPTHLKNRFRLDLLGLEAAGEAITRPAEHGGRECAPEAVKKLVHDLATMKVQRADGSFVEQLGHHVEPLQLQVVCRRLWERMPEDDLRIDLEDVAELGDVTEALSGYYAGEVEKIAGGDERIERATREWVGGKLITPDGIRGQVLRGAGKSEGLDNNLIASLVNTHLVRGEQRAGAVWYELAHDRLIEPVRNNNREWFDGHLHKMQKTATVWEAQGKPEGLLLLGKDLLEAKEWASRNEASLTATEREFLKASSTKQQALEKEQQQTRRLRVMLAAVVVIALLAIAAAGKAYYSSIKATKAETRANEEREKAEKAAFNALIEQEKAKIASREADNQRDEAQNQAEIAQEQTQAAKAAEDEAEKQKQLAHSNGYIAGMNFAASEIERGNAPRALELLESFISGNDSLDLRDFYWYHLWKKNRREIMALTGHEDLVQVVAFSPDGKTIASVGWDKTMKLWDAKTGNELATFPLDESKDILSRESRQVSIAFSPDGKTIASAYSNSIKVWDIRTGSVLNTFNGGENSVWSVTFSPDGKTIASAGQEGKVRLWNVETGELQNIYVPSRKNSVRSVIFSPDGKMMAHINPAFAFKTTDKPPALRLFSGKFEICSVNLWNAQTGIDLVTLTSDAIFRSIAFSPNGKNLISANSKYVILWDAQTGKPLNQFSAHENDVSTVAFSPDGKTIASAGKDQTIRLWDAQTGNLLATLIGHEIKEIPRQQLSLFADSRTIAFSPDGKTIASASGKMVLLLDLGPSKEQAYATLQSKGDKSVAFSPDGTWIASAGKDENLKLWNLRTGKLLASLRGHKGEVTSVAISPDGMWIASGGKDKTLKLWNVQTGKMTDTFPKHEGEVASVVFSPDRKTIASVDGEIKLWDTRTHKLLYTFNQDEGAVTSIAFSPDGKTIASVVGGVITLRNVQTHKFLASFSEQESRVTSITFSPDGKTIATAGTDNNVKLWDTRAGRMLITLSGHVGGVRSVTFSPDGKLIASASADKTVKLWNVRTGTELTTLIWNEGMVNSVAFSPDGKTIASASDNNIKLLTGATEEEVKRQCIRCSKKP